VTVIGFDPEHAQLLSRLADECEADEAEFKGPFNVWLHFDKLPYADARDAVSRHMDSLVEHPADCFLY
jgi:hypothetical protein